MIQKFSNDFLRKQCDLADPKMIGYTETGGTPGPKIQVKTTSSLKETINFVVHAMKGNEAENGEKNTILAQIYRAAIQRGHSSDKDDDLAPIVDFSGSPREHIQILLEELSAEEPETLKQMTPSQLLGRLLRYVPSKPFEYLKATASQPITSAHAVWKTLLMYTCVDCRKQLSIFMHGPSNRIKLYGYGVRTEQHICRPCLERFYRNHAKQWLNKASSFIEAGTLQDLKAAFGCIDIAVSLHKEVSLFSIAKQLVHKDIPELALPLVLAIEQQSIKTIDKVKANKLLSSVLKSLADRHSDKDVRWTLLEAAKEAALLAANNLDGTAADAPSLHTAVEAINKELHSEKERREAQISRLVNCKKQKVEQLWACRNLNAIVEFIKTPEDENEDNYALAGLERFIQGMEKFLSQMRPEDRYSLLFFQGILKLHKKRYTEGIADIEAAVWHTSSTELLRKEAIHILLSLLQSMPSIFKLDGIEKILHKNLLTRQGRGYDDFTSREHQLLYLEQERVTPPFNSNWPALSVVGINLRAHRKCEAAFEKQLQEKTWGHKDIGYAYVDYIQGCVHPAELANSLLHASMWFLKDLNKKLEPSEKFALKKLILSLLGSAFIIAHRSLHPGMQLYVGRLALGVAIETLKRAEDVAEPEDSELVSALLHMVTYNSRFVPFWNFPTVPVSEAALLSIISAELHSDYLDQLTQTPPAQRPMTEGELRYQLYENDLRYIHHSDNSEEVHVTAMEELLSEKGWNMSDVTDLMTSPLSPRDGDGYLIQQPKLGVQLEFAEIKGMILDLDRAHPSIQLVVVPANHSRGRMGTCSQTDFQHVLSMEENTTGTLFFSLEQPDDQKRFHPFQEFRYTSEDLYKSDMLHTLFETDYLMKSFSVGSDVSAKPPFNQRPNKEGLTQKLPQHLQEKLKPVSERGATQNRAHRFWIQADKITYSEDQVDSKLELRLGEMEMKIRSRPLMPGDDGKLKDTEDEDDPDSPEAKFAADMTEVYDELGLHFPMFLRLKQLAKLQVLGLFLRGILEGMKEKANGQNVTVPEELYQRIRSDALEQLKEQLKRGLDSVSSDIGVWPAAEDRDTVSSEVRRVLRELPSNVYATYSDVEPHITSALRKKDESIVTQLTDALMDVTSNRLRRSTLTGHIRSWLRNRSQWNQNELLDYISSGASLPTREMLKRQIIDMHKERYGHFSGFLQRLSMPHKLTTTRPCKWVPAALHKEEDGNHLSLCYGGVLISPKVEEGSVSRFASHTQRVLVQQRHSQPYGYTQVSGTRSGGAQNTSTRRQSAQNGTRTQTSARAQSSSRQGNTTTSSSTSQGVKQKSSATAASGNKWNFGKTGKAQQSWTNPGKHSARGLCVLEGEGSGGGSGDGGGGGGGGIPVASAAGGAGGRGGGGNRRGGAAGGSKGGSGGGGGKKGGGGGKKGGGGGDGGGGGRGRGLSKLAAVALALYGVSKLAQTFGKNDMKGDAALKKVTANLDQNPPCQRPKCKACTPQPPQIQTIETGKATYKTTNLPMNTENAIYMLQCKETGKVYVGMTLREANVRIKEHLRSIAREKGLTLPKHFNNLGCFGQFQNYMNISTIASVGKERMRSFTQEQKRRVMLYIEAKMIETLGHDNLLNKAKPKAAYEKVVEVFAKQGKTAPPEQSLFQKTEGGVLVDGQLVLTL